MNLNQVRVFHAVALERNITAAARRLKVSQPAVSKQLAELEQSLGTTLVDRLPRGVSLTKAGSLLLAHAERIFLAEAAAEQDLAELSGLERGLLAVAASTTIGAYIVPRLFGAFNQSYPRIELDLEIGNAAQVEAAVLENRVDLGLSEGFVRAVGLDVEVFDQDDIIALTRPGASLLTRAPLSPRELLEEPFICRESGSGTRAVIEAALAAKGLHVEPAMCLGSTEAIKNGVAAGLGVALVSRSSVALELETGRLAEIPMRDLEIRRDLHLVRLKGKHPSAVALRFLELLRQPVPAAKPLQYRI